MKKILVMFFLLINCLFSKGQNLISNPSFDTVKGNGCSLHGNSLGFNDVINVPSDCGIVDWIGISETPDPWWFNGNNFPSNFHTKYLYPHSDSVCIGEAFYNPYYPNTREIIEGKLTKPLVKNHHYQFSMYVQLFDTLDNWTGFGKIVAINSFSALFTDTIIQSHTDLPIQNYHAQIQIDSLVTDTQHWVLLVDTFIAAGGEQFVSIGNFKRDSLTKYQLVDSIRNKPEASYYFMDDVSLIDLDEVGIEEVEKNRLTVFPNPTTNELRINLANIQLTTIEISNVLGQSCIIPPFKGGKGDLFINTESLQSSIYLRV